MYVLFSDNNFEPKLFNLVTAITTYGVGVLSSADNFNIFAHPLCSLPA